MPAHGGRGAIQNQRPHRVRRFRIRKVSAKAFGRNVVCHLGQGTAILADISVTGTSISDEIETLATLIEVSNEALSDGQTTFEGAILEAIVEGLNYRLDWASFRADGTDDTNDGGMTGIFANADVPVFTLAAGKINLLTLERADFTAVIGKVTPSALQRPCRWWINPKFLPTLLPLRDDQDLLLMRPTVPGGDWTIDGFPVTWTAAAPDEDGAAKLVAAFGRGDAYTVLLRQQFQIARSADQKFNQNLSLIRATARARCKMRDATSFALLKTAP